MGSHFQVFVRGVSGGSDDDWFRAKSAPESELPELSDGQKDVARRMGIAEQEYARGVPVNQYSEERHLHRGQKLREHIEKILTSVGHSYHLEALARERRKDRWVETIVIA